MTFVVGAAAPPASDLPLGEDRRQDAAHFIHCDDGRCDVLRCVSATVHDAIEPLVELLRVLALVSEDLLHTIVTAED